MSDPYDCACVNADARVCYLIRYHVDPADDWSDGESCECPCHGVCQWDELEQDEHERAGWA